MREGSSETNVYVCTLLLYYSQIGNWAQSMLLNPCRTRRRLRRGMDDWANLYQHALHADLSAGFNKWMESVGWNWVPGSAGPRNPVTGDLDLQVSHDSHSLITCCL